MGLGLQGCREEASRSGRVDMGAEKGLHCLLFTSRAENSAGTISCLTLGWPWQHSAKGIHLRETPLFSFSKKGHFYAYSTRFFFNNLNLFIYLFLAVLGLRFYERAFSSCGERGPLFIAVRGPLTIAASLVAEHRLQTHRLSSCGARA